MTTSHEAVNPRAPILRTTEPEPKVPPTTPAAADIRPQLRAASDQPAQDDDVLLQNLSIADDVPTMPAAKRRWLLPALLCGALLLLVLGGWQLVLFIDGIAERHWLLALPFAGLAAACLFFLLGGVFAEWRALRRLQSLSQLRARGDALLASDALASTASGSAAVATDESARYAEQVLDLYRRGDQQALYQRLRKALSHEADNDSNADRVRRLSAVLHAGPDREAMQRIATTVRRVGALTAINPLALLDSLLVLWLTLRMIRSVAEVYGGRPGLLASWQLARRVALAVAAAGASDLAADSISDSLGAGLAGSVSGKLGQGVVTGLLVARVGLYALQTCRPVPLAENQNQGHDRLWRALRQTVLGLS